jgi:hypothetical protein
MDKSMILDGFPVSEVANGIEGCKVRKEDSGERAVRARVDRS